jgi:small-conductance mechanosensitive channel
LLSNSTGYRYVVAKRLSFILGGIFDNLVFTLYYIALRIAWGALLRDAAVGAGGWGPTHLLIRRICSSLIAWGVIHTVSRGIARYMEVYFQREAFFHPIMKALAEEFVVVTLLSVCSMDMRHWLAAHSEVQAATPVSPPAATKKTQSKWVSTTEKIKHMPGLHSAFAHIKQVQTVIKERGTLSLSSFLRLAKETLPIKTDMIILKEGAVQPTDLSLARLHKMGVHIRRKKLQLPERFVKNANNVLVRGDLPRIIDEDIVHRSVASTTALRMIAVMRQIQGARRFVPLDAVFFNLVGLPKQVQDKVMEVLDTENAGVLKREQIVRRFEQIYERRRDLARSLASTNSVLATLESITLSALYVVLVFVVLGIFDQNILEMWFTVSSMFLAFVFMFGNSIRQLFESVIFIFIIHPFDVGDAVLINGVRHKIQNISILTTETTKWNGHVIYYPNSVLNANPMINLTRTKSYTDEQTWVVDLHTPQRVFEALPMYLEAYAKDHAEDYVEITPRIYSHADDPMKIKITVFYQYTFNGLPPERSGTARDRLGLHMRKFLVDNGVVYRQQVLPVELVQGDGGAAAAAATEANVQDSARTGTPSAPSPSNFLDLAMASHTVTATAAAASALGDKATSRDDFSIPRTLSLS